MTTMLSDRIATLVSEGGGTVTAGQIASRYGVSRWHVYRDWIPAPGFALPINPGCKPLMYLSNDVAAWWEQRSCTCNAEGPDAFGNYDRIADPDCPVHER